MPRVLCDGLDLTLASDENLLDALLAAGIEVASACRAGACQQCLVKAVRGVPPAKAQSGLKDAQRDQGYFLACQAKLTEDLTVSVSGARELDIPGRIVSLDALSSSVMRVLVKPEERFSYRAGQYITLIRADGLARSYSIANRPDSDRDRLELHVRVFPQGRMSGWLASSRALHASVSIRGPLGECFYVRDRPTQPLLLVGTGTGLAPLWGILNDALAAEHTGPIELWHGARTTSGLYLVPELEALADRCRNFTYRRCILEGPAEDGVELCTLDSAVLASASSFEGRRVFLCGDAALVQQMKRKIFLKGASMREIHADAFLASPA
jgi:NAD(P)H-flavin reductase